MVQLAAEKKYGWSRKRGPAKRPWRLYGTTPEGKHGNILHRAFGDEIRAHNAAMADVRWGEYKTIEVYDVRSGVESGTHGMRANGQIHFSVPKDGRIADLLKRKGVTIDGG